MLITDREQGYITVGQNVPFLVSSEVTDGGNTIQKIERQNVGVSLRVTPHIIGDTVLMNINQTSSSVSNSDIASDIITNNRQIQTVIQAKDGQSIILGGLVGEESRSNDTGVPILKDILLIGSLFSSTSGREIIGIDKGQYHLVFAFKNKKENFDGRRPNLKARSPLH